MGDIEHLPCCNVCGVAYIAEYEGPCQEPTGPGGRMCSGRVSWEATADRLRGAVSERDELRRIVAKIPSEQLGRMMQAIRDENAEIGAAEGAVRDWDVLAALLIEAVRQDYGTPGWRARAIQAGCLHYPTEGR